MEHRLHHTDLAPRIEKGLTGILATLAEVENRRRTEILMRAKRFHAAMGHAITRPPSGYVVTAKGQWGKDVSAVSERIADVFHLYQKLGSVRKVVRALAADGFELPLRSPAGELRWVRPTLSRIYNIITNPAYMGWYVFGRHARIRGALHRQRKTAWEERIMVRNHHAPYVTPETWHRINQWLRRRAGRGCQQTPMGPPHGGESPDDDRAAPAAGEGCADGAEAARFAGRSPSNLNTKETNE